MPANNSTVRVNFLHGLKDIAELLCKAFRDYDQLATLYNGAGLSGTFSESNPNDFVDTTLQHLDPAFVATVIGNMATLRSAATATIVNNLAKTVGKRVTG